ncbi:methyltransferase domain-containing protein [Methanoculleus sp. 7T]|uniref:methyltransferase domain-containing protein n=1 Tax=Methanoculleus sp. 7T TaxID=2937282 RepID=UPI0020BE7CEC|nr:methyltransferase domain-containing protein [Methanoculleus sp. 7T]MCK8517534.1 class I SAM-dependent methyltransferase [Methanoculleus sp. 7T]
MEIERRFLCQINLGRLDRLHPISTLFGYDRGQPIDRYYVENFLLQHKNDIHGRVLEIGDDTYTKKFGGTKVKRSDILHAVEGNPSATIVADIAHADNIPSNTFDCIILTQTLQFVYDLPSAINHLHRILKPGGVLLATVPGISQISRYDIDRWGEFWRFTTQSAQRLFEDKFSAKMIEVEAYGNVLIAIAFLHGLAVEELNPEHFEYQDPDYQVLITVRAAKSKTDN